MSKTNSSNRDKILIRGARVNNLKNIDVEIPREKLVVVTGLSGSGKSTLAFDTVFAEGNRRYLEGMSGYARNFLDISAKPEVDKIENLSPAISIDQKSVSRSPRSTVGTMTEIYDYLRVLFAKAGTVRCPECRAEMSAKTNREVAEEIASFPDKSQVMICARMKDRMKTGRELLRLALQSGFVRAKFEGKAVEIQTLLSRNPAEMEEIKEIEVVVDRVTVCRKNFDRERILDSIETAFRLGKGRMSVFLDGQENFSYNRDFICPECDFRLSEVTPKNFSFNSPEGACPECSGLGRVKKVSPELIVTNKNLTLAEGAIMCLNKFGAKGTGGGRLDVLAAVGKKHSFSINVPMKNLTAGQLKVVFYGDDKEKEYQAGSGNEKRTVFFDGVVNYLERKYRESLSVGSKSEIEKYMLEETCPACRGKRLKKEYLAVEIGGKSIWDVCSLDLSSFAVFLEELENLPFQPGKKETVGVLAREMSAKNESLINVGLEYLSLSRGSDSISGGEAQRIRLATQIGSELSGIIYVLDEPSIGLHCRDTRRLIETMERLRRNGNSLLVVEHDADIIRAADWVIDMGPGAGEEGGRVVFEGDLKKLLSSKTATAGYITGKKKVFEKKKIRRGKGKSIEILGARENNLKNIDVKIPLGVFISICGVSGSGKSTLVSDILSKALSRHFWGGKDLPGEHKKIKGLKNIKKVISIDQSPIGRTPRSNAATYTGVFSLVREIFAKTQEAGERGYSASRFSFNMKGGRCEDCQGDGTKKIEMHLLPDMYVKCETCQGTRYNQKTLEIEYQGVNVSQVLDMSVSYALRFFKKSPLIYEKLKTLEDVGLGYLRLGQSATNLSGGEAQRIKLATELSRKSGGDTLYVLDEPTIGLHFEDVKKLLGVLDALVEKGNTVLVVEHNLDVIKNSDWVLELGPEGGKNGGQIVYQGLPGGLKKCKESWTGKYL